MSHCTTLVISKSVFLLAIYIASCCCQFKEFNFNLCLKPELFCLMALYANSIQNSHLQWITKAAANWYKTPNTYIHLYTLCMWARSLVGIYVRIRAYKWISVVLVHYISGSYLFVHVVVSLCVYGICEYDCFLCKP